ALDLCMIWEGYGRELEGKYMDGEDETADMIRRLPESGLMENTTLFVYGFDMITEELRSVITALSLCAADTCILVCSEKGNAAFAPVTASLNRLQKSMAEAGRDVSIEWLKNDPSPAVPALQHLQTQLLQFFARTVKGEPEGISLKSVPNAYTEMHVIAESMLLENRAGVPFDRMALVTDGSPAALSLAGSVLSSYMIPLYVAQKLPALSHGLSRFLLASLRFIDGGQQSDMLDMVHSGYCPAEEKELYEYENYILSRGIRGKLFDRAFRRGEEEERQIPEKCRKALMTPLLKLKAAFESPADTAGILTAVYDYLTRTGAAGTLNAQRDRLEKEGYPDKALQNDQVWDALMKMLDQMHSLLEGYELTPGQLALFLEAGLSQKELSALPPAGGCVMCGALGNMPLNDMQIVFAAGLCDSLMEPAAPMLLTDREQADMEGRMQVHFSLSGSEQDDMRRLDIWKTFSAPEKKLYLSHPQATQDGAALSPLPLLGRVRRIFPDLKEEGGITMISGAQQPLAPVPALNMIPLLMQKDSLTGKWRETWQYLCTDDAWTRRTEQIRAAFRPPLPSGIPEDVARKLFGDRVFSITRLENFAECPFKNYIEYGLKPVKRDEWDIPANEAGTFYHDCMESFTRLLPQIEGWPQIDKKTCDEAMEQAIGPHMKELMEKGPMQDSARLRHAGLGYKKALKQVAWAFTKASRSSAFRPGGSEVVFGDPTAENSLPALPITMPDGTQAFLRGRIDRIDRYEGDEGMYLRVVDYKSSAKKIDGAKVWWGTQLQLLLYLNAALENDREKGRENTLPAGAFYSHITDPLVDGDKEKTDIEEKLAEQLRLEGLALRDAAVIRLMDSGEGTPGIPGYLKKDESFREGAQAASLEDMRALLAHARRKAGELMQEMMSGRTDASPLCSGGSTTPCTWCEYASICRRDPTDKSNEREMGKMSFDELVDRVNAERDGRTVPEPQG
ncbi:MAG: hypothetical protein CW338_05640, partial [Clostridiales bacterium]|nr:hypothetical protein [Clostridiales bacterium]